MSAPGDELRSFVRAQVLITGASAVRIALGAARMIVLARLLAPELYGLADLVTVVAGFSALAALGAETLYRQQYPRVRATGGPAAATYAARTLRWTLLNGALFAAAGTGVLAWGWGEQLPPALLAAGAAFLFLTRLESFLNAHLISCEAFGLAAAAEIVQALALTALGLLLAWRFSVGGLVAAMALALVIKVAVVVLSRRGRGELPWRGRLTGLGGELRAGRPFLAGQAAAAGGAHCDRALLMARLSVLDLGLYSYGFRFAHYYAQLATALSRLLQPAWVRRFGAGRDHHRLDRQYFEVLAGQALMNAVGLALVWVLITLLLATWHQEYRDAQDMAFWILLGIYFSTLRGVPAIYLFTRERNWRITAGLALAPVVQVPLTLALWAAGWGRPAVAWGFAAGCAAAFLFTAGCATFDMGGARRTRAAAFAWALLGAALFWAATALGAECGVLPATDPAEAGLAALIVAAVAALPVAVYERQTRILRRLWALRGSWFAAAAPGAPMEAAAPDGSGGSPSPPGAGSEPEA